MSDLLTRKVLDKGYVTLLNLAGPTRRPEQAFDAHDRDPANSARLSFDAKDTRPVEDDLRLDAYLWKHQHTTPFESIEVWFEIKLPIFVARQLVRHRTASISEVSRRYVDAYPEFYIPSEWRGRATNKKQGSGAPVERQEWLSGLCEIACNEALTTYERMLDAGVAPEQARIILPINLYTRWQWKQDFHNLMHMLKLRSALDAQYETRQYALAMISILRDVLPDLMEVVMPNT